MNRQPFLVDQSAAEPMSYSRILDLQRGWAQGLAAEKLPGLIWIGTHKPVITLGRQASEDELMVPAAELPGQGVELHSIERGGLATVHGPGQLVCYPILNVTDLELGVREFVRLLEQAMIDTLTGLDIDSGRDERGPGVWYGDDKLGFVGLALKRRVSFHGLALNIELEPTLFDLISPCGLVGIHITSAKEILGRAVDMGQAGQLMGQALTDLLAIEPRPISLEEAEDYLAAHAEEA